MVCIIKIDLLKNHPSTIPALAQVWHEVLGKIWFPELTIQLRVKIYEQDQLVEMLKAVGFKHIHTLKAFDQSSQPENLDESIVYECRK